MTFSNRFLATLVLLPCTCGYAYADNPNQNVERVLVTATRMEIPVDEALSSVVVIDREQIERSMAADVAELLRFHAGLEIGRNGGPGQTTSLFIRGTESNHTLVLIDGVEVNPGTLGAAALQNIAPNMVERIEVVKGPRSSLYGSEAIGGVVNIITRYKQGVELRIGRGRYNTRDAALSAGTSGEHGQVSASVSHINTEGFPTRTETTQPNRGYDNMSYGLNASTSVAGANIAMRHWQSRGNTEYLDFFLQPVDQDYHNQATAISLSARPAANWDTSLQLGDITDDIEQRHSSDFAKTERLSLDWQNDIILPANHRLVAGLYLAREKTRASSFGTGFNTSTDVSAIYLEDYFETRRGQLMLAARYSDFESFGDKITWNVEYGHRLTADWRLTAAAGEGFRAPDATDRFGFGGNPNLRPEQSRSFEVGIDRRLGNNQFFRISLFRTEIDDLIEFSFPAGNQNVASARIEGAEAAWHWNNADWQVDFGAILQDPVNRDDDQQLARRARRSLSINAARQFGQHSLGIDLLATAKRPDSAFSSKINAGYVLANLSGKWQLSDNWALQGRLENLLDRSYETAADFRSPGRSLHMRVLYQR
ncbi:MAG: TonB-dependent receptor [Gammaproteobacteria bacterium]|nr:TonB-dependent receptor [Gammaproteobacteria bacterium]